MKMSVAATALLLTSTAAFGADLAPHPIEPTAPIALPFSWTGFYAGVNAGYAFGGDDRVGVHYPRYLGDIGKLSGKGFLGGVQVGYNYQLDSIVVGIEADFQGSQVKDDVNGTVPGLSSIQGHGRSDVKWFGTLRPRIGYAYDRFLIYATGGLAYGSIDYKMNYGIASVSESKTKIGWTAGAGVEYAITDNLSGRIEYDYVDFGEYTVRRGFLSTKATPDFHVVRVGLNYKF